MSRTVTTLTAQDLAERLGGTLEHCPPERPISEVKPLEEAGAGSVSFLANPKYAAKAKESLRRSDPRGCHGGSGAITPSCG